VRNINFQDYIECRRGTIPLIFSVPHGGTTNFDNIPDRTSGIYGVDKDTVKLALDLIENINELFQLNKKELKTPSYIFSKIKRVKIDFNRKESEAFYLKSSLAKEIYHYYHNQIKKLISYNLKTFNRSLLIDIHGFEKSKRPKGYRDVELVLGTNNLKSMFPNKQPKKEWGTNFRGKIIRKFNELNILIAPGIRTRREYVLTGGYIIQNYGASRIKNSQAIQIEFSDTIRLYDDQLREKTLKSFAQLFFEEFSQES
jgi:N-formylglutamate amidohydrolase